MEFISSVAVAFLTSLVIVALLGPIVIPQLKRLKMGQVVRDDGPQTHLKKAGTPTMGGIMFVAAFTIVSLGINREMLSLSGPTRPYALSLITTLVVTLAHAAIGFADDYIKVALKRPLGLRAREKMVAQALVAVFLSYMSTKHINLTTWVMVPFVGTGFDLGIFYPLFVVILVLAATNAVNFVDGLDGLCASSCTFTFIATAIVALVCGNLPLAIFSIAVAGSCVGFLVHNHHPARVFMGDTGSLALGAALASVSVLTKSELLLPITGGLYVIVTLSVIIQVASFQLTGKRVFKMAPLQHHFELLGFKETTIVAWFSLASLAFAVLGLFGLRGLGG